MSIERSAELLRQALPWMSRQSAALHPISYAVWFDYVAHSNPPLSAAIDEHLAREGSLDEFATHALFRRHVADVDPESAQRLVDGIHRVLGGIGETSGAAAAYAARYAASLAQLAGALERGDTARGMDEDSGIARNGPPPRMLADVVAEVIADTGAMRSQVAGLQQRLADSRREVDRLREEVRRARDDALHDSLTGLCNRRAFDQALAVCLGIGTDPAGAPSAPGPAAAASAAIDAARATPEGRRTPRADQRRIAQASVTANAPGAPAMGSSATDMASAMGSPQPTATAEPCGPWLLMSNIDHFKGINDSYGHAFGDEVLKTVAEALRALAPGGSTVARVDGEVFALLVPELDAATAAALAERIRGHIGGARIRRPGQEDARRITLSLGLTSHRAGETPHAFVARADTARQQAMRDGRDRVVAAP